MPEMRLRKLKGVGMREDKRFTIKIMGEVFESDADGFLDLNEIWRGCGLPTNKRPSQ